MRCDDGTYDLIIDLNIAELIFEGGDETFARFGAVGLQYLDAHIFVETVFLHQRNELGKYLFGAFDLTDAFKRTVGHDRDERLDAEQLAERAVTAEILPPRLR